MEIPIRITISVGNTWRLFWEDLDFGEFRFVDLEVSWSPGHFRLEAALIGFWVHLWVETPPSIEIYTRYRARGGGWTTRLRSELERLREQVDETRQDLDES